MGNYNNDRRSGGRRDNRRSGGDRGGNRGFGRDRDDRPEMHQAICSDCGNECEVPFRPTGEKPVYCSDCFRNKGEGNSRDFRNSGDRGDRDFERRDFGNRDPKLRFDDKKPSFKQNGDNDKITKNLEQINITLNKILVMLASANSSQTKESKPLSSVDLVSLFDNSPANSSQTKESKPLSTGYVKPEPKKIDTDAIRDLVVKATDSKAEKSPTKKKASKKKK